MKKAWAIAALSLCMIGASAWAADDPQTGRWKLDLARSKYVTGVLPKSSIATVTPDGDGVSLSVDVITADGKEQHIKYAAKYDGKHYPRTESGAGAVSGQTVTLKRIDAHTAERIVYLGDKPGGTERWSISADGKTRTVVQSGLDLKGKPINNLQIYLKQ